MKISTWPGAAVLAATVIVGAATSATALGPTADQQLDGVIVVAGNTCTWTNARTSANPPSALTVDRTTINTPGGNLGCSGGITASLNNNPAFTFDDAAGLARTDAIDITGKMSFISCRYKATNITWNRDGATRKYLNQAFTATRTSGSFLCPGSVTTPAGDASMLFH
ncbi:hypothetical protein CP980_30605 [Streptomyces vinaceus]|uniref:Ig-like domain-containing protein n=1 Tax=Streptomyces vinaceus TaxID=1960 RepID=A0A5J6JC50_STRVI|nr:hypothetical protein [Streptomyces vinaceus]QEV48857.1 hypothetical protein CP980_30605 [Streptomyces vinaceus]GHE37887.1 hypothetical protein GCM10017778_21420 [Streptomyces vinaceus]